MPRMRDACRRHGRNPGGHLAEARGLIALLERELPYRRFDAARIPLYIVASDEASGAEVLLSTGDVVTAVRLGARQLRQDFDRYRDELTLRIVPPLCPQRCSPLDCSRARR